MAEHAFVGKSVPRVDALEKVTGRAKFSPDIEVHGMLHVKVLRSTYAHARIVSIDTSEAEKLPGVKGVATGRGVPDERLGYIQDRYVLARDVVRFVGEPVKSSFVKAILTDLHFWVPVVVLILGVGLLVALR